MIKSNRSKFLESLKVMKIQFSFFKLVGVLVIGYVLGIVMAGLMGILTSHIKIPGFQLLIATLAQNLPVLLLLYLFLYKKDKSDLLVLLFPKKQKSSIFISTITYFALFIFTFIGLYIFYLNAGNKNDLAGMFEYQLDNTYLLTSMLGLVTYLILAFMEELIFRFTIFRYLRKRGLVVALLASSLLFAVVHMNVGIPFALVAGIIFALHYEYSNSIIATTVVHAIHNYATFYYSSYLIYLLTK